MIQTSMFNTPHCQHQPGERHRQALINIVFSSPGRTVTELSRRLSLNLDQTRVLIQDLLASGHLTETHSTKLTFYHVPTNLPCPMLEDRVLAEQLFSDVSRCPNGETGVRLAQRHNTQPQVIHANLQRAIAEGRIKCQDIGKLRIYRPGLLA